MAPKKKQEGNRTTLYRLLEVDTFKSVIREKYLDSNEFTYKETDVGDCKAATIYGAMHSDKAKWSEALSKLAGFPITQKGITPAALLLIHLKPDSTEDPEVVYALSYGMGFQLLEPAYIDNLFGQRIVIRTADPQKLQSITVTTMDDRSKTSRASIPLGDGLLGFGIGDIGEAVSRLSAIAEINTSRASNKPLRVRGADALNLPVGLNPEEVLKDLQELERILKSEPQDALKMLDQLALVRNPGTKDQLNSNLLDALENNESRIGISWPHERINENGTPDSWNLKGLKQGRTGRTLQGIPEWSDIQEYLSGFPVEDRLNAVGKAKIQLFKDAHGEDAITQDIPLMKWIAFETNLDNSTYCLYDGKWYQIHHDYAQLINTQIRNIFERSSTPPEFPTWNEGEDEEAYNIKLATQLKGVCLDRKLIRTELHPRGIEACDVYLSDGTFIHVKKTESSDLASHLLAQALVSTDAICNDASARLELKKKIKDQKGDNSKLSTIPVKVILAMHRKNNKRISADELFTFTKVNLIRQVHSLESRGVTVEIIPIY